MSTHSERYTVEEASSRLSETVDSVARTQGRVTITRDGQPVAVIMSFDELKTIDEETLAWMNAGGISAYQDSRAQFAAGDTIDLEDLRDEFGSKNTPAIGV